MLRIETGDLRSEFGQKRRVAIAGGGGLLGRRACLRLSADLGMGLKCGISGTSMNGSCCRVQQQNTAATPVPPYPLERSQKLAFVPRHASLQLSAASVSGLQNALEEPPKFPPGSSSILRL